MSVHWPIYRRLLAKPTREVIVDDQRSYKAIEILIASLHMADIIEDTCKSDTVALMLPTSGAFPIAALGAWAAGKTIVPLNYLLKRDELQYVIDDCGADTLITAGPLVDFLGYEPQIKNTVKMETLNFKRVPSPRIPKTASNDQLSTLLYTSGTSGKPKGVMLTHGNLKANLRQIEDRIHFGTCNTMLGVLPQFHTFGLTALTLVPLTFGPKVVYTARFNPNKLLTLIRKHRPDTFIGIPSMYNALLKLKSAGPDDFKSLVYTVSGGEPLPDAVANKFFDKYGTRISEGYGMTECAPVTNWCTPEQYAPHTVGKTLPGMQQRIICIENNTDVTKDGEGEIRVKGPNVMKGYYKRPEDTAAAFDDEGWLRTGDMGRFDEQGRLYITGRIKEMIIVGGENVFPREIEEVLNRHPAVQASGVTRLTDPTRGEVPVAFVELTDEMPEGVERPSDRDLIAHCREHLAGYKVPKHLFFIEELPRNPTGKIMRKDLAPKVAEMLATPTA
ncbi:MAG: AMP-binding protein [Planctomycetota bacterium]